MGAVFCSHYVNFFDEYRAALMPTGTRMGHTKSAMRKIKNYTKILNV